jgi:hypothetical protein
VRARVGSRRTRAHERGIEELGAQILDLVAQVEDDVLERDDDLV